MTNNNNNKNPLNLIRNRRRSSLFRFLSSSSPPPPLDNSTTTLPPSPQKRKMMLQRQGPDLQTLFKRFWKVASPYWFSDDKVEARIRLASVFALTLATTGISVGFNFLGRDFYNALANKDQEQFTKQLMYYLAAFAGGIPVFVLRDYAKETLALRWRSWMTSYYMDLLFTGTALSFSLTLFSTAVDLVSFSNILLGIYPPLFVILIVYSLGGTAISVFLGRGLVNLNFLQEKKEADFRYGLVRVRENAESIAFYGGEENEIQLLLQRFRSAFENLTTVDIFSKSEFFTNGYRYLIQILPAAVVAPMYFSGKIEFGVINQSVSAFNHILGDFSLIVYQFQAISAFSAVIDRLGEFDDVLDGNSQSYSDSMRGITIVYSDSRESSLLQSNGMVSDKCMKLLDVKNLKLETPKSRTTLIRNLSLEMDNKDHLLITGPSGCGKTSLLRAMAGLWSTGEGKLPLYPVPAEKLTEGYKGKRARVYFFLPQRPYMVLGTLRQQLLYPTWSESMNLMESTKFSGSLASLFQGPSLPDTEKPTDDDLVQVLEDVRLDSMYEWSSVLSLGEQQRLAFARLLLSKPKLVLLDESTSALDEDNEAHLYKQIEAAGITYISVGHRRTLHEFHCKVLHISKMDTGSDSDDSQRNWLLKPIINQDSSTGSVEPVS
ncbi:hypothetical protein MKW92_015978 [Papaver armeniacum]|nr:hypothetical protein MKW92_015978 [Papaver armeniacum]